MFKRICNIKLELKKKKLTQSFLILMILNKSISEIEPNGFIPNDLYDQRDLLVDQLSKLVNVKVESVIPTQYGIADRAVAEGLYKIELILDDGTSFNLINVDSTGIKGMSKVAVAMGLRYGICCRCYSWRRTITKL